MIQVEPIFLVVSGDPTACQVHLATRYQDQARAFAAAFAHDPARPRVQEFQAAILGADFAPGLKPFTVILGREGSAVSIDPAPRIQGFGYFSEVAPVPPNFEFRVWARDAVEAERVADVKRTSMLHRGEWHE